MQAVGGHAAQVRGSQCHAAAADELGIVGGEAAQYDAAHAVTDEMQRFAAAAVVGMYRVGQPAGVLLQGVDNAVIAETAAFDVVCLQAAGGGQHGPSVHMQAVQEHDLQGWG